MKSVINAAGTALFYGLIALAISFTLGAAIGFYLK